MMNQECSENNNFEAAKEVVVMEEEDVEEKGEQLEKEKDSFSISFSLLDSNSGTIDGR